MNKWNRSQSPSAIPRLLQKRPLFGSADSIPRTPSPVKTKPGSKLPTPTIRKTNSTPNLKRGEILSDSASSNKETFQIKSVSIDDSRNNSISTEPFEELLMPSSHKLIHDSDSDDDKRESFLSGGHGEDNWLLSDGGNKIQPLLEMDVLVEESDFEDDDLPEDAETGVNRIENGACSSNRDFVIHQNVAGPLKNHDVATIEIQHNRAQIESCLDDQEPLSRETAVPTESGFLQQATKENVMYITENLIKRITKVADLNSIKKLNLCVAKQWKRKIQFIENLEPLRNLEMLKLSNNFITKIQKLNTLVNLRYLDLSMNQITNVEGLETLVNLESLYLDYNHIESFPNWFGKKMRSLQTFSISNNRFTKLDEFVKLASLSNLSLLDIRDNPCCRLNHLESFVVFHLRSLNTINGKVICIEMRNMADQRFSKDEIDCREKQINELQKQNTALLKENRKLTESQNQTGNIEKKLIDKVKTLKKSLHTCTQDLETKNGLLESKTTELNKACEKQYKLEQELAFYKLDAKFDEMWQMPPREGNEMETEEFNEHAYIGKARYKKASLPKDNIILNEEQSMRFSSFLSRLNPTQFRENENICTALEQALDIDLSDLDAYTQVERIQSKLDEKNLEVDEMRAFMNELEIKLEATENSLERKRKESNNLRNSLNSITNADNDRLQSTTFELNQVLQEKEKLEGYVQELNVKLDQSNKEIINQYQLIRNLENDLKIAEEMASRKVEMEQELQNLSQNAQENASKVGELVNQNKMLQRQLKQSSIEMTNLADQNSELNMACEEFAKEKEDSKQRIKELKGKVKSSRKEEGLVASLEEERDQLIMKNNELKKKMDENRLLKENYDSLLGEYQTLQRTLRTKDSDRNEVFDYIKTLVNDMLLGQTLQQPVDVHDKSMQATLTNLCNTSTDYVQSHNDLKQRLANSQLKMKQLMEHNQQVEKENRQLLDAIQALKEDIDVKESEVRVRNSEFNSLKDHYKNEEEKNLKSLKEYDEISSELRGCLEKLEQENEDLKRQLEGMNKKILKAKVGQKKSDDQLKIAQQHVDDIIRKELQEMRDDNMELTQSLEASMKEATYWENQVNLKDNEFREKIEAKEGAFADEMEKLLDELRLTKNYIAALQKDVDEKKQDNKTQVEGLTKNLEQMEDEVQKMRNEKQDLNGVFDEISDIKSTLLHLSKEVHSKTPNRYEDLSNKLNILEAKISSKSLPNKGAKKNQQQATKDVNKSLQKALKQVDKFKSMLHDKCAELEKSNVPSKILSLQREEISNLIQELQQKEEDIRRLSANQNTPNSYPSPTHTFHSHSPTNYHSPNYKHSDRMIMSPAKSAVPVPERISPSSSPNLDRRKNVPVLTVPTSPLHHNTYQGDVIDNVIDRDVIEHGDDIKHVTFTSRDGEVSHTYPNVIHHKHFFNNNEEEKVFTSTILPDANHTERDRDHLKWELTRLEAKVGDAMIRRSLHRKQFHY
ncbi:centriolin-like isoform X2 [Clytia hemisphaerica]|uniref:centriolin-like isoform X2 n=1 Tax=Clytia hemisphaerica TaxID=252671 RepID=UPI0034D4DA76